MRTRAIVMSAFMTLLALSVDGAAQTRDLPKPPARDNAPPSTGSASLTGTILSDTDPARPLRRVIVMVNSADRTLGKTVITDDNGRFNVTGLPAGRYNIDASKRGWVYTSYGAKGPGKPGTTVPLTDGQRATISIRLPRGGVITGTILDENGQPPSAVNVRVMRYMFSNGERRLAPAGSLGSGPPDERGQYRIYGLTPGDYYVVATAGVSGPFRPGSDLHLTSDVDVEEAAHAIQNGPATPIVDVPQRTVAFSPVYYPGVNNATQASQITVRAGEERTGIDFVMSYVAAVRVEGTVTGVDGMPAGNAMVTLVNRDPNAGALGFESVRNGRTDARGQFSFGEIAPGSYLLDAHAPPTGWVNADLEVQGDDLRGLSLAMQEAFSVSGSVRFDGPSVAPPLTSVRVMLVSQATPGGVNISTASNATATADGHFTLKGVSPGRYRLSATMMTARPAWTLRTSSVGGQEALDSFVDIRQALNDGSIVFTDQLADLSGHASPESTVILFSANQSHWSPQSRRVRFTRAAGDGSYVFRDIPPGEYQIAAVDDVEQGQWTDPAYLQSLASAATKVTIAEGEKKTVDIHSGGA